MSISKILEARELTEAELALVTGGNGKGKGEDNNHDEEDNGEENHHHCHHHHHHHNNDDEEN